MMGDEELPSALNRLGLSDETVFRIRPDKYYMYLPSSKDNLVTDGGESCDSSSDEDERMEKGKELMKCRREGGPRRLERSHSADLVLLRAADSPHDNQFFYVHEGAQGELKLRMGFVNPKEGGKGVFKRRKKLDETELTMVYCYTNLHFDKSIGVQLGAEPSVSLMEPPQSPVSTSDPRMFRKLKEPYHNFRLESAPLKGYSITYSHAGDVTLSQTGSPLTEREGNPANEIDSLKPLLALSGFNHEGLQPPIVAEYPDH